jgi:ribonuclease P protein component
VIGKQQLSLAVDRNRLKRMLREAVRLRRPALDAFDIVLRLRRGCPRAGIAAVGAEAARLLDTLTPARSR